MTCATWQIERRKRTRHLIELGGLVVKSGIVDLTGDDRTIIFGALLWMADKLQSEERAKALALWAAKGKQAFEEERVDRRAHDAAGNAAGSGVTDGGRRGDPTYRSAARHRAARRANTSRFIRRHLALIVRGCRPLLRGSFEASVPPIACLCRRWRDGR